jgi:hypothetical protein
LKRSESISPALLDASGQSADQLDGPDDLGVILVDRLDLVVGDGPAFRLDAGAELGVVGESDGAAPHAHIA